MSDNMELTPELTLNPEPVAAAAAVPEAPSLTLNPTLNAEDVAAAFTADGLGAIVNSSRGIICAWQKNGGDYQIAARNAAIAMRDDITRFTNR